MGLASGYVYKWVNSINNKWYIGSHNGSNPEYKASGIAINRAFDKYGIENFTRSILMECDEYLELEEFILQEADARNNQMSYNMKNYAIGGATWTGGHHTEETKERIYQTQKSKSTPMVYKGTEYRSIREAAKLTGDSRYLIRAYGKTR